MLLPFRALAATDSSKWRESEGPSVWLPRAQLEHGRVPLSQDRLARVPSPVPHAAAARFRNARFAASGLLVVLVTHVVLTSRSFLLREGQSNLFHVFIIPVLGRRGHVPSSRSPLP